MFKNFGMLAFSGVYGPLTLKGNFIVDEVLASCYASGPHDFGRFGITPIRWLPDITDWILSDDEKFSAYITIFLECMEWLLLY